MILLRISSKILNIMSIDTIIPIMLSGNRTPNSLISIKMKF